MTAAKDKAKKDDQVEADKKAGAKDESKTLETTDEQAARQEDLPTKAEEVEKDDDQYDFSDDDEFEGVGADEVEGAVGTVLERDYEGNEYEVPYALVTTENLPRTSDSDDHAKSWTAQEYAEEREDLDHPVAVVPVQGTPGQTFRVRELPDRDVVEAAGIDYAQFVAGLPVRVDVPDEAPRKGIPA